MDSLKNTLIKRDGISEAEADERIDDLRESMFESLEDGDLESAYHVCEEEGLEPDYLLDLLY